MSSNSSASALPNGASSQRKRVLIVYAHPEPRSLNGSLRDAMAQRLRDTGHDVQMSDLHAMGWKAVIDAEDFPAYSKDEPVRVIDASRQAYAGGTQTPDVVAEQEKLLWADALILQFPLWWFSMPAILKGWVDRVYAYGFAYGVGEHSDRRWGDRYGEGTFVGKRAMLVVTAGGWDSHYSERGVNGPIQDLLFPIHHGVLHYPGYTVLPPFVAYRSDRMDASRYASLRDALLERIDGLWEQAPIPFRCQNGGDYELPALTLRHGLEAPGHSGFALHLANGVRADG